MVKIIFIFLIVVFVIIHNRYRFINNIKKYLNQMFKEDVVITSIHLETFKKTKFGDYHCLFSVIDKENNKEIECRLYLKKQGKTFLITSIKRFYYNKIRDFLKIDIESKLID
jgi:hypothetical protein